MLGKLNSTVLFKINLFGRNEAHLCSDVPVSHLSEGWWRTLSLWTK